MTYPIPWHNQLGYGLTLGPVPDPSWDMEFDGVEYPTDYLPEEQCEGDRYTCSPWMYKMGEADAFTNNTYNCGLSMSLDLVIQHYSLSLSTYSTKDVLSLPTLIPHM